VLWIAVGIAVSALLLWWSARGLRLGEVAAHVRGAPPGPVLLAVVAATLVFPLRMLRWQVLLRPGGGAVPTAPAWHAIAIGYMANNVLGLRSGEVLRPYALSRLTPIHWSTAFASVAVERVFDAVTVVVTLLGALLFGSLPEDLRIGGLPAEALAWRVGLLGLGALAAALALMVWTGPARAAITRMVPHQGIAERLLRILDGVRAGFVALRSPALLAAVALWSGIVWGVNALSFGLLLPAFGIEGSVSMMLVLQAAIVFGVALPSTPGYIGAFEAAIVLTLGLYGVPQDTAFAYAITYHVTTFIPITLLGFYSLARTPVRWRDARALRT